MSKAKRIQKESRAQMDTTAGKALAILGEIDGLHPSIIKAAVQVRDLEELAAGYLFLYNKLIEAGTVHRTNASKLH